MANKKKISIVFEETGPVEGGNGFNVYLEGHRKDLNSVPEDQRTAAEFWAAQCFNIVTDVLKKTGAMRTMRLNDVGKQ